MTPAAAKPIARMRRASTDSAWTVGVVDEGGGDGLGEQRDGAGGDGAVDEGGAQRQGPGASDACGEPAAGVVPDDRLHPLADAELGHRDERLDAGADRERGQRCGGGGRPGQRGVDDDDEQGGAEAGEERGGADADEGADRGQVGTQVGPADAVGAVLLGEEEPQAHRGGDGLAADRSQGGSADAEVQPEDEQRVEGDLDGDRDDPQHRGEPHPPLGAHQAGEPGRDDRAGQDDRGVVACVAEGRAVGAEQPQERLEPGQPDHGGRDGGGPEHDEGVPGRACGGARVAGAEVPGDDRRCSDAEGGRDRAQRQEQRGDEVDRRHRGRPDAAGDEPGVGQRVDPVDPDRDGGLGAGVPQQPPDGPFAQGGGVERAVPFHELVAPRVLTAR